MIRFRLLWRGLELVRTSGRHHAWCILPTGHAVQLDRILLVPVRSRRQAEQLYIARCDVQTHALIFFHKRGRGSLYARHTTFIFCNIPNLPCGTLAAQPYNDRNQQHLYRRGSFILMSTILINAAAMPTKRLAPALPWLAALALLASAMQAAAAEPGNVFTSGIRLQDEIVVVNVRNVCGSCDPERLRNGVAVEDYAVTDDTGHRSWRQGDLASFLAFDASVPTVIFVHGNQITPGDAKCEGLSVYRRMILNGADSPRIRFVIFSWPSSKVGGLLQDVRIKAARTGPAGCQLAWLVDQLPVETPVSFVGFSFGARIITGSLHILGGGSLGGSCHLGERVHPERPQMSVILMASALHSYWLGDNQYHGRAMTQVSRLCLINNSQDPAMKYYDFIEPGRGGPQALGYCGPTRISRENAKKIVNRDVSCYVGNEHDLIRYLCAPGDAGLIWDYTAGSAFVVEKKVSIN